MNYKHRIDDIIAGNIPYNAGFEMLLDQIPKEGLILEFGVSAGDTIKAIQGLTQRPIYGFDCWEGLPEDWIGSDGKQVQAKGAYKSDPPEVDAHVTLVSGLFEDSLPGFLEEHSESISFIHIDCDLYTSTKTIFKFLTSKISPGTIIIFDEFFNYPGWQDGEFKAFMEWTKDNNVKYEYIAVMINHQKVALRIL